MGTARMLITVETTIEQIINTLKNSIKGESTEIITAKIMATKQSGKLANAFVREIDDLAKQLAGAYISDGVLKILVDKYTLQTAVKSLAENADNDKVKLVMETGQFTDMNQAVEKFVNINTESISSGQIRYYQQQNRGFYR